MAAALSSPRLRVVACLIAAMGLIAVALGGMVGTRAPMTSVTVQPPAARSITFSYGTTVRLSNAYDSTEVIAPDPVFRSVADSVDVTFAYLGPPGQVEVDAELSLSNGWHSNTPLLGTRPTDGKGGRVTVRLDLDSLAARAAAGAKATGGQGEVVGISVVPRIINGAGEPFAPTLALELTPLALTLKRADGPFAVQDAPPAKIQLSVPRVLTVAGRDLISVSDSRVLSATLLLAAALAAAALMIYLRRTPPPPEGVLIRRLHSSLLIEVEPVVAPTDRPVVEVTEFKTLVRLAQRYGLLILHWTIDEQTTFTVHDDATAYLYHTAALVPAPIEKFDAPDDDQPESAHWQGSLATANDALTKLANRSLFEREVQHAIETSDNLCLMLISVDSLDTINAEHGRAAGDAVLVKTAERLRRAVRPGDLVARLTGDGFGVLFEGVGHEAVDSVASRILAMTHEAMLVDDQPLQVQVRLGLASADSGQNAILLIAQATSALVKAKAADTVHHAWYAEESVP